MIAVNNYVAASQRYMYPTLVMYFFKSFRTFNNWYNNNLLWMYQDRRETSQSNKIQYT